MPSYSFIAFTTRISPWAKRLPTTSPRPFTTASRRIIIHGALHSFRELNAERNAYCQAIGLTSTAHDKARQISTQKLADHPLTRFWPAAWNTESDELYQNIKLWPSATGLLSAYSPQSKKDHVVAWINRYGKGRVFGTTLGHGKPTTDMESYHRLLANGLLWICDKLDDNGQPKPGYGVTPTNE